MEEAGGQLEVVMFPWLAFGHMIPFLELSKRLAARGHAVAFVSTPRNLARLPPVPPHLSGRLRFVPLPLPVLRRSNLVDKINYFTCEHLGSQASLNRYSGAGSRACLTSLQTLLSVKLLLPVLSKKTRRHPY